MCVCVCVCVCVCERAHARVCYIISIAIIKLYVILLACMGMFSVSVMKVLCEALRFAAYK